MIGVKNVSHTYGAERVLTDVSLSVSPGEVVAVIGPSGVGKTTLLRIMALFERPDRGTVEIDGTDAWTIDEEERLALRRQLGMVFQEASLFDATVERNVAYGLRIRKSWRERIQEHLRPVVGSNGTAAAVREALDVVGLEDKVEQEAQSLSGGEAQRASFARALAYDPTYLLLDEPTSDLDPRNTGLIEEAVIEARDRGIGVVVATHDMHQAERIADRVGVLLGDGITEIGPTDRIFGNPRDERTEQFISGELVY